MKAATYVYVLLRLTENVVPKLADKLEGSYKDAFQKIFALLEDSGWQLKIEEQEGEDTNDSQSSGNQINLLQYSYNFCWVYFMFVPLLPYKLW